MEELTLESIGDREEVESQVSSDEYEVREINEESERHHVRVDRLPDS